MKRSRHCRAAAAALTLAALGLAACDQRAAPMTRGVCWRDLAAGAGEAHFVTVSTGVSSLDDCAAQLEALHLVEHGTVVGAFQGYFLFVDAAAITSAPSARGFRYPIFQPSQRAEIDADLRRLIKERNGALPSAGDLAVERK